MSSIFDGLQKIMSKSMEIGREYVVPTASFAYGDTYNKNTNRLIELNLQSVNNNINQAIIPSTLLRDFETALGYSKGIYLGPGAVCPNGTDFIVLSVGIDERPDCIAFYSPDLSTASYTTGSGIAEEDGTIWVVLRGTNTLEDIMKDLSWIIETQDMQEILAPGDDFQFPRQVTEKAMTILTKLLAYVSLEVEKCTLAVSETVASDPAQRRRRIKRVCFSGHSLGGALATALHVLYNAKRHEVSPEMFPPSESFTIGAPLLFHGSPEVLRSAPTGIQLWEHTHNIVFQLDPVPRLLGAHGFPTYILESFIGPYIDRLTQQVDRTNYRPFGQYYCLRNKLPTPPTMTSSSAGVDAEESNSSTRASTNIAASASVESTWHSDLTSALLFGERPAFQPTLERITDPIGLLRLLATFPTCSTDFVFSALHDHSAEISHTTLQKAVGKRLNDQSG